LLSARQSKIIKTGGSLTHLGCSFKDLCTHIESLWEPGMSWENHPKEWQIDHIKALGLFDLTDPKQIAIAAHYTNPQPLWTADHHEKPRRDRVLIRGMR
jgi:hypothetical protein